MKCDFWWVSVADWHQFEVALQFVFFTAVIGSSLNHRTIAISTSNSCQAPKIKISAIELGLNEMTCWIYLKEQGGQSVLASSKRSLRVLRSH